MYQSTHHTRHAKRNQSRSQTPSASGFYRCSADGTVVPGCGAPVQPLCDVQMVTGVLRNLAAATTGELTMAPKRTNLFQVLKECIVAVDNANPGIYRQAEVVSIEINRIPQEPFSDALVTGSTSAALLDFFGRQFDGYGKPVAYGIYSQESLIQVFKYGFANIEAVPIDIYAAHYGNSLDVLPPGVEMGVPFN